MDLGIQGRTALVTGGASDLGRASAEVLLAEGATVILADAKADAVASIAADLGDGCHALHCDPRQTAQITGLAETVKERFRMPDILVCAATSQSPEGHPLADLSDADWYDAWELEFMAVVRTMRAFLPHMARCGWGRAVAITERRAPPPGPDALLHETAGAAVASFARGLSQLYADRGVVVNTVSPALIAAADDDAASGNRRDPGDRDAALAAAGEAKQGRLGIGRRGRPAEVAVAVAFLCSDRASFVNGADYRVDGGALSGPRRRS